MAAREAELWPENADALALYGELTHPVVSSLGLTGWLIDGIGRDIDGEGRLELVRRLGILYDEMTAHGRSDTPD